MRVYLHVRDQQGEHNTPVLTAFDQALDSGISDGSVGSFHSEGSDESDDDDEGSDGY
jgi:hypothetical protein